MFVQVFHKVQRKIPTTTPPTPGQGGYDTITRYSYVRASQICWIGQTKYCGELTTTITLLDDPEINHYSEMSVNDLVNDLGGYICP